MLRYATMPLMACALGVEQIKRRFVGMANENGWVNEALCTSFTLVEGCAPGKMEISAAFFNAFENNMRVPSEPSRVIFTAVRAPQHQQSVKFRFYARIMQIGHEDGSGESFIFRGYLNSTPKWDYGKLNQEYKFEGWMNVRTRKGWLKVENIKPEQAPAP